MAKSFAETHPHNPNATCECEHWQSCIDCHPTAHSEKYITDAMRVRQAVAQAVLQEPVEYQYRTRPDWIPEWNGWNICSKESAEAYEKNPYLHDWHYEVRRLYTTPPQRTWVGLTFEQRCRVSEQCLPEAPYREMLTKLHDEMLAALAQPVFIKHHGDDEGWSEWVCPDPDDYLISCCDCGLVHQAQFRVAKYAPAPSEECEIVNDPDLQAQFRMRRSEEWTPEDTAHRAGGLPMAQPYNKPYGP